MNKMYQFLLKTFADQPKWSNSLKDKNQLHCYGNHHSCYGLWRTLGPVTTKIYDSFLSKNICRTEIGKVKPKTLGLTCVTLILVHPVACISSYLLVIIFESQQILVSSSDFMGNENNKLLNELKFRACHKEFKNLVKAKMHANFDDQNRNNLTKKFWSYVKSTSKSTWIPEVVYLKGKTSSDPRTKVNMFKEFFYNQFSEASEYDVNISFNLDSTFDIDFNVAQVQDIISKLDSNKAQGPYNIHGLIFKKCSSVLAKPLSLIFTVIYNTGILPEEWKLLNIVPVFKKGDKKGIENYHPISLTCIAAKVKECVMYDELLCHIQHLTLWWPLVIYDPKSNYLILETDKLVQTYLSLYMFQN